MLEESEIISSSGSCGCCVARCDMLGVSIGALNPLKPTGHYMYRQFNIHKLFALPTHCIYVFCVDLRTNSHYFPIQH